MQQRKLKSWTLVAGAMFAAAALVGCKAQGDGTGGNGDISTGDGSFPNDGTTPGTITDGGTPITGNFVCEKGVGAISDDATTVVATGGLIGDQLTALLNQLGGSTVTALLNSVTDPENLIDHDLSTFANFSLTLGLLGLTTVDEAVLFHKTADAGTYAVFGLTFPQGTLEATLIDSVTVHTFLNGVSQETVSIDASSLDLLGQTVAGPARVFLGVRATKSFDSASVGLAPGVISANVGSAMHANELCTGGKFVTPPT